MNQYVGGIETDGLVTEDVNEVLTVSEETDLLVSRLRRGSNADSKPSLLERHRIAVCPTYLAISGGRKPVRFIGLLGSCEKDGQLA